MSRTLTGSGASDLHFRVTLFRIYTARVIGAAVTAASIPPKVKKITQSARLPWAVDDESKTTTPGEHAKPSSSYVVLIHDALSNSDRALPSTYHIIRRFQAVTSSNAAEQEIVCATV